MCGIICRHIFLTVLQYLQLFAALKATSLPLPFMCCLSGLKVNVCFPIIYGYILLLSSTYLEWKSNERQFISNKSANFWPYSLHVVSRTLIRIMYFSQSIAYPYFPCTVCHTKEY